MLRAVVTKSSIEYLKANIRVGYIQAVPVPMRRSADAIACGFGSKNMGVLKKELENGPQFRELSDEAFVAFLCEFGYTGIEPNAFSQAVTRSMFAIDLSGEISDIRAPYVSAGFLLGTTNSVSSEMLRQINKDQNGGCDPDDVSYAMDKRFKKSQKSLEKALARDPEAEAFVSQLLSEYYRQKPPEGHPDAGERAY